MNERLYRSSTDRVFTGLCGGIADYFDIDASLLRILTVILDIFTGIFPLLIVYIIAAMVVPEEPPLGAPGTWTGWGAGGWSGGAPGAPGTGAEAGTGPGTGAPGAQGPAPDAGTAPGWGPPPAGDWRSQRTYWRQQRRAQRQYWRSQRWGAEPTNAALVFGVILVVVGGAFLVQNAIPSFNTDLLWPAVLIVLGAALLAGAVTRR